MLGAEERKKIKKEWKVKQRQIKIYIHQRFTAWGKEHYEKQTKE